MTFTANRNIIRKPENCNHRALFKGCGYSDEDLERPMIGIANSWNEIVPGHTNLRSVAEFVKKGIYRAGGTAVEFGTIAACDGIAQGDGMFSILPTRDLIASSIEMMVKAHSLDAIVLLGSCDKIVPGMLMAAARLDIPAILLPGGPMQGGEWFDGRNSDSTSMSEAVGLLKRGAITEEELYNLENSCVPTCGSCSFLGSANTMCAISEALGLSPSGAASIPAYHNDRLRMAEYTGERIVDLVINHITARQILTIDAIENAIILANATGGSTNTIIHLTALGHELGYSASQIRDLFEARGRDIPQIVKINPSAAANTDDLFRSGGIRQVLKELRSFLHKDCMTVEGISMGEVLDSKSQAAYMDRDVLRTVDDPFSVGKGLAVLYGNLAPDSCITKPAAIADTMQVFTGRAKVFNSEEEAAAAILSAQIQAGDLLVIRYEGPKGGPGMREMCNVMKSARTITLHVEMKEIEHRLRQIQMPKSRFQEGYLAFYSKHATSAAFGAVLD